MSKQNDTVVGRGQSYWALVNDWASRWLGIEFESSLFRSIWWLRALVLSAGVIAALWSGRLVTVLPAMRASYLVLACLVLYWCLSLVIILIPRPAAWPALVTLSIIALVSLAADVLAHIDLFQSLVTTILMLVASLLALDLRQVWIRARKEFGLPHLIRNPENASARVAPFDFGDSCH